MGKRPGALAKPGSVASTNAKQLCVDGLQAGEVLSTNLFQCVEGVSHCACFLKRCSHFNHPFSLLAWPSSPNRTQSGADDAAAVTTVKLLVALSFE